MLGSMATDSPCSSYFPHLVAVKVKSLLDQSHTPVLTAELHELLQSQAPLFFEFCTVLDALHDFTTIGQMILLAIVTLCSRLPPRHGSVVVVVLP